MTPEFKKLWVEALRSGKYQQTKNVLRNDKGFCCVGVALDLVDSKGWGKEISISEFGLNEALGLTGEQLHDLANRNDGLLDKYEPQTFAQIADHIEGLPTS